MIRPPIVYGTVLVSLGCWATFTTSKLLSAHDGWKRHRSLVLLGGAFVASCLLPGIALLVGAFVPWMLIPLGVAYVALIPFPCYFKWANDGWVRTARILLFLLVGVWLVAAGLELLPLRWFGLTT